MPPDRRGELAGDNLQPNIKIRESIKRPLVFSECRADASLLLEAIQGEVELPRFLGQGAGQEKGIAEAVPRLPVLGVLRQAALEVGDRLLPEIAGFVDPLVRLQRPADFGFEDAEGRRREDPRSLRSLVELRSFKSAAAIWSGVVFR